MYTGWDHYEDILTKFTMATRDDLRVARVAFLEEEGGQHMKCYKKRQGMYRGFGVVVL